MKIEQEAREELNNKKAPNPGLKIVGRASARHSERAKARPTSRSSGFSFRRTCPARLFDHGVHCVSRGGALAQPIVDTLKIDIDRVALRAGPIRAEIFDRGAITARTRLGNDHTIKRLVHGTNLGKTDFESHVG